MKLNIAYPATGGQKVLDITDEHRIAQFVEKRISQEVDGSVLGDDFKGYIFKISGGNDKQGFPMKQGILTPNRVRVMLKKGDKCFRERRSGERKRKSIRGCIVSRDICILDLIIVKKGPKEIEGITDVRKPRRVGPKRAGKIRKLFGLTKNADVRKYVVRHKVVNKKGKEKSKAPKIQRLTTPLRLKRKKHLEQQKIKSAKKTHEDIAAYKKLLQGRQKAERQALLEAARLKKEKKQKKEAEKLQGKKKPTTTAVAKSKAKAKTLAKGAVKDGGKDEKTGKGTTKDAGKSKGKDTGKGAAKDAGKGAAKSAGKGAGKDAGKSTAKDAGKGTAKDAGKGAAKNAGKGAGKDAGKSTAKDAGKGTAKDAGKGAAKNAGKGAGKDAGKSTAKDAGKGSAKDAGKGAAKTPAAGKTTSKTTAPAGKTTPAKKTDAPPKASAGKTTPAKKTEKASGAKPAEGKGKK